jgi:hypothetical protein
MQTSNNQVSNNNTTWEQGKQRLQEGLDVTKERLQKGLDVTKEKVGLKPTPKTDYGSIPQRDTWGEGKQRLQEGFEQGKERLQEGIDLTKEKMGQGIDLTKEKMGLPTNSFARDLQAQKKTLRHVEPTEKRQVFHDVKLSSGKTGTEGFDVNHPTPEPNEGVISNLTHKVQEVFISAKQMVGMNHDTGRSSDKAGCEAFRAELWQTALKIQGPKLMDAEYSSGLWPVVTKQLKGAFNTTKGAFNTTTEWIKNKAPITGTHDTHDKQTFDDSKSIWVQGKEGIQLGIESAKEALGLKPTPTVSPTDKAMENFGKEKPVEKDQQTEGVI